PAGFGAGPGDRTTLLVQGRRLLDLPLQGRGRRGRHGCQLRARRLRSRPGVRPELPEFSGHGPGPDRFRSGNMNKGFNNVSVDVFESHGEVLDQAGAGADTRGYWSRFPDSPSPRNYGETAEEDGRKAFEAHQGKYFPMEGHAGSR